MAFGFARIAGGALPWYLFYASLGLVLAAALWAWGIQRTLQCTLAVDRYQFQVGETIPVRLRVETEGFLPLPWVEVTDGTPAHLVACDAPRQATAVAPLGSRVVTFHLRARRRGHFRIGPITAVTGDGFGLFTVTRAVESPRPVTVYPRVVPLREAPVPLGQPFGHIRTRQKAFVDPYSLAGIRPYQPGDNPRHIHWRVSARRGELHLKEFELTATTELVIFLDLCAAAHVQGSRGETGETAVELAASLADLAARRHFPLSLVAVGDQRHHVPLTRGHRALDQVLEVLARVEMSGSAPLAQVLQFEAPALPPRATLALITPRLDIALAQEVLRLRESHPLMLIALQAETFAPENPSLQAEAPAQAQLRLRLAGARVPVYAVAAGSDIGDLAAMQVLAAPEPGGAAAGAGARRAGGEG